MTLKVVLLTTDTTHHAYFAWKLSERFALQAILLERRQLAPPFETFHPFETLREEYERNVLLSGFNCTFADLADTRVLESVNDPESVSLLKTLSPDVVLVFGTGKLLAPVTQLASVACLNLHGGNPEQYRGLDTHLWTIYHRDFNNLVTTLHHVDEELDSGDIVFQSQLILKRDSGLQELRSINTKTCVNLTLLALNSLQSIGSMPSRRQLNRGRYYSFMPYVLKEDCIRKFERHIAKL